MTSSGTPSSAQRYIGSTYKPFEMFLLAGVLYLAIITVTGKVIAALARRVRLPQARDQLGQDVLLTREAPPVEALDGVVAGLRESERSYNFV